MTLTKTNYTKKKETQRVGRIKEVAKASRNGSQSCRFTTLKLADFADDKEDFKAYKTEVDLYHKALYTGSTNPTKDKYLVNALQYLCLNETDILKLKKANIHKSLEKATMRDRQTMTAEGKEQKTIYAAEIIRLENGFTLDKKGEVVQLAEDKAEELLVEVKQKLADLLSSNIYNEAVLSQVSQATFRKSFEKFIGNFLNGDNAVMEYVTAEQRGLNKVWTNLKKKCENLNISEETFTKYFEKHDKDGLQAIIKEEKAKTQVA